MPRPRGFLVTSDEEIDALENVPREIRGMLDIDVTRSLECKLAKSAVKYPIEKVRGSNVKYTEL